MILLISKCDARFIIFLNIICELLSVSFGYLVVSNTVRTWEEAALNYSCSLAGIQMTADTAFNDITFEIPSTLHATTEAWIGAREVYSDWIDFEGCRYGIVTTESKKQYLVTGHAEHEQVEFCLSICGSEFMLHREECYCNGAASIVDVLCKPKLCKPTVDGGTFTGYCGHHEFTYESNTYYCMCQYRRLPFQTIDDDTSGNCKSVSFTLSSSGSLSTELHVEDCKQLRGSACWNHTHAYTTDTQSSLVDTGGSCDIDSGFQLLGEDFRKFSSMHGHGTYWVGIFRFSALKWGRQSNSNSSLYNCISLSVNTKKEISKRIRKCHTKLPVLCNINMKPGALSAQSAKNTGISVLIALVVFLIIGIFIFLLYLYIKRRQGRWKASPLEMIATQRQQKVTLRTQREIMPSQHYKSGDFHHDKLSVHSYLKENSLSPPVSNNDTYDYLQVNYPVEYDGNNTTEGTPQFQDYDTMADIRAHEGGNYTTLHQPSHTDDVIPGSYDTIAMTQKQ